MEGTETDFLATDTAPPRPIDLLLVADLALLIETVSDCLEQHDAIASCTAVPTFADATAYLADHPCDVVVVDMMMAERSAIDGVRAIRQARPDVRIVALAGHAHIEVLADAVDQQVDAFAPSGASLQGLVDAAYGDLDDDADTSDLLARVTNEIHRREQMRTDGPVIELTPRERDVLALLAGGMPLKDISRRLDIQLETCRGYVKSLLSKLGARSQLQAVVMAARYGLLPPIGVSGP
jgi:DNA-binding NarL/FixJ family response regulator